MFGRHKVISPFGAAAVGLLLATHSLTAASGQSPPAARRAAAPAVRPAAARPVTNPLPAVSLTQKGPDTAPVTIVEFSDFECPFCGQMPPVLAQLLAQYPGQIRFLFKHSPLRIHPNAPLAAEAAMAAAAQGKFWEMHDLLFENQRQLGESALIGYARQLHLDVPSFAAALRDHRYKPIVDQDLLEARAYGVNATPTFFVNGQRYSGAATLATLKGYVDAAMGRSPSPTTVAVPLANEPRATNISVAGAPMRGADAAPVTIVEFTDLQCPFCAQSVSVMQQVMAAYEGRVKWFFKNFPLSIHPNAKLAHQAVLAANEQGKFWAMHDALFADQRNVSRDAIIATAGRLGFDVPRFTAALDSPPNLSRIDQERQEGETLGVSGTPTFFVNGRKVVGSKSFGEMKSIIDLELLGRPATAAEIGAGKAGPSGPDVSKGDPNAPIEMLWYTDLRSPLAARAADLVKQVMAAYPGQVRVSVKHRPLESRPESTLVHEAAIAAAAQGRFWEMQDLILGQVSSPLGRDQLIELAARLKLDQAAFAKDLDERTYRTSVEFDLDEAQRRAIRGTPVFFLNGQRVDGIQPFAFFQRIVDEELRRRADK